jgi:hypothetical protein
VDDGTLTDDRIEAIGSTLMALDKRMAGREVTVRGKAACGCVRRLPWGS